MLQTDRIWLEPIILLFQQQMQQPLDKPRAGIGMILECLHTLQDPESVYPIWNRVIATLQDIRTQTKPVVLVRALSDIVSNIQTVRPEDFQNFLKYLFDVIDAHWQFKPSPSQSMQHEITKREIKEAVVRMLATSTKPSQILLLLQNFKRMAKDYYIQDSNQIKQLLSDICWVALEKVENPDQTDVLLFKYARDIFYIMTRQERDLSCEQFDDNIKRVISSCGQISDRCRHMMQTSLGVMNTKNFKMSKYSDQILMYVLYSAPIDIIHEINIEKPFQIVQYLQDKLELLLNLNEQARVSENPRNPIRKLLQKNIKSLVLGLSSFLVTPKCLLISPILSQYTYCLFYIFNNPQFFLKNACLRYSLIGIGKIIREFTFLAERSTYRQGISNHLLYERAHLTVGKRTGWQRGYVVHEKHQIEEVWDSSAKPDNKLVFLQDLTPQKPQSGKHQEQDEVKLLSPVPTPRNRSTPPLSPVPTPRNRSTPPALSPARTPRDRSRSPVPIPRDRSRSPARKRHAVSPVRGRRRKIRPHVRPLKRSRDKKESPKKHAPKPGSGSFKKKKKGLLMNYPSLPMKKYHILLQAANAKYRQKCHLFCKEYFTEEMVISLLEYCLKNVHACAAFDRWGQGLTPVEPGKQGEASLEACVAHVAQMILAAFPKLVHGLIIRLFWDQWNWNIFDASFHRNLLNLICNIPRVLTIHQEQQLASFPVRYFLDFMWRNPSYQSRYAFMATSWIQFLDVDFQMKHVAYILLTMMLRHQYNQEGQLLLAGSECITKLLMREQRLMAGREFTGKNISSQRIVEMGLTILVGGFSKTKNISGLSALANLISVAASRKNTTSREVNDILNNVQASQFICNESVELTQKLCIMFRKLLCIIPRNQKAEVLYNLIGNFLLVNLPRAEINQQQMLHLWYITMRDYSVIQGPLEIYTSIAIAHLERYFPLKSAMVIQIIEQYVLLDTNLFQSDPPYQLVYDAFTQAEQLPIYICEELKIACLSCFHTLYAKFGQGRNKEKIKNMLEAIFAEFKDRSFRASLKVHSKILHVLNRFLVQQKQPTLILMRSNRLGYMTLIESYFEILRLELYNLWGFKLDRAIDSVCMILRNFGDEQIIFKSRQYIGLILTILDEWRKPTNPQAVLVQSRELGDRKKQVYNISQLDEQDPYDLLNIWLGQFLDRNDMQFAGYVQTFDFKENDLRKILIDLCGEAQSYYADSSDNRDSDEDDDDFARSYDDSEQYRQYEQQQQSEQSQQRSNEMQEWGSQDFAYDHGR